MYSVSQSRSLIYQLSGDTTDHSHSNYGGHKVEKHEPDENLLVKVVPLFQYAQLESHLCSLSHVLPFFFDRLDGSSLAPPH